MQNHADTAGSLGTEPAGSIGMPAGSLQASASMASSHPFMLDIPEGVPRRIAVGWLSLGLCALVGAGLFAILLVLSRTPYIDQHIPWVDFFHTALVVHVDLSVLVWLLAFAGVFWNLNAVRRGQRWGWLALVLSAAGTIIMAAAPFFGAAAPLMSNYLPVLQDPLFLAGLVVFALGVAVQVILSICCARPIGAALTGGALRFGINTAAIATAVALMAFTLSYLDGPRSLSGRAYFEQLFWGGGHILQYTYTQLVLVAWLWLAAAAGVRMTLSPRVVLALFAWGLLWIFFTPIAYLAYGPESVEFHRFFLWLMAFGGSLAAVPIGAAIAFGLVTGRRSHPEGGVQRAALISSMALFGVGGMLAFLIHGNNVTVPAHYHGCIVGVTLAFMGMTYDLLPRLGFELPSPRWAARQAYIYGGGQLLHITGLAWSGGYGVGRKIAGAAQGLNSTPRILGMGLMGIGGLIAIVGGMLFLLIVFHAIYRSRGTVRCVSASPV